MIITEFLIIKVRLLLTADFAWLTSELNLLINSPDLCSQKKYMSFEINFEQKSLRISIAKNYWRNCKLKNRAKVKNASKIVIIPSSRTPTFKASIFLLVSSAYEAVMRSKTFPTFRGSKLIESAKHMFNSNPVKRWYFLLRLYLNNFFQIGHENFFSCLSLPDFPLFLSD